MADAGLPQIYLITPPQIDLAAFLDELARSLDRAPVACLRLALSSDDPDAVGGAADALRECAHARDIPLVVDSHVGLAERHGLDGVHLPDGARSVRKARSALGADSIVGAFCGGSRHDGLNAGEAGADYVAFGPTSPSPLGDGGMANDDLFSWWSEMIELPIVAEGRLSEDRVRALARSADFFAFGPEIWSAEDPAESLAVFARVIEESA